MNDPKKYRKAYAWKVTCMEQDGPVQLTTTLMAPAIALAADMASKLPMDGTVQRIHITAAETIPEGLRSEVHLTRTTDGWDYE